MHRAPSLVSPEPDSGILWTMSSPVGSRNSITSMNWDMRSSLVSYTAPFVLELLVSQEPVLPEGIQHDYKLGKGRPCLALDGAGRLSPDGLSLSVYPGRDGFRVF